MRMYGTWKAGNYWQGVYTRGGNSESVPCIAFQEKNNSVNRLQRLRRIAYSAQSRRMRVHFDPKGSSEPNLSERCTRHLFQRSEAPRRTRLHTQVPAHSCTSSCSRRHADRGASAQLSCGSRYVEIYLGQGALPSLKINPFVVGMKFRGSHQQCNSNQKPEAGLPAGGGPRMVESVSAGPYATQSRQPRQVRKEATVTG